MERYSGHNECVVGTDKAILNLFRTLASPTSRARLYELIVASNATPADLSTDFVVQRTTAVGTEDAGFTPLPLDTDSSATCQSDFGCGAFSVEPTKTANSELLRFALNQRATFRWVAAPGGELIIPATQNNGACLNSESSGGTANHLCTMFFQE